MMRVIRLSRIYLSDDWKPFLLTGMVFGGLAFLSGLLMRRPATGFLFNAMLLVGIVLVSRLFAGIHSKEKGIYLFMLPAATMEKFVVQWAASLIGFYAFAVLAVATGSTLSNLVAAVLYQSAEFEISYPVGLPGSFRIYCFFHALFFCGALVFRQSNFLKTTLVLMAVSFVLTIGSGVYLKNSLLRRHNSGFFFQFDGAGEFYQIIDGPSSTAIYYAKVVALIIIPFILYGISYYRFKQWESKG
jgi:hypothetical protein